MTRFGKNLHFFLRYGLAQFRLQRQRTILLLSLIALATCISVVAKRYSDAVLTYWRDGAIDSGTGHLQILMPGRKLRTSELQSQQLLEVSVLNADLTNLQHPPTATPRLRFEGMASAGKKSMYFFGLAVEPAKEQLVAPRLLFTTSGIHTFQNAHAQTPVVAIGRLLAESLNVKEGDQITLLTPTAAGAINGLDMVVGGMIDVPLPDISKRLVVAHLDYIQSQLGVTGKASELVLRFPEEKDTQAFISGEGRKLSSYNLLPWWTIEPLILRVSGIWNSVVGLLITLLFAAAGISIWSIVSIAVSLRVVEMGTLLALGASRRRLIWMIGTETALLALLGSLIGALAAAIIIWVMGRNGLHFSSPFTLGEVIIRPTMNWMLAGSMIAAATSMVLVATIKPALDASSVSPLVSLRGQGKW